MRKLKHPHFAKTEKELISSFNFHSSLEIYPHIQNCKISNHNLINHTINNDKQGLLCDDQIESMCKGLDRQIGFGQKVLKPQHDTLRRTRGHKYERIQADAGLRMIYG